MTEIRNRQTLVNVLSGMTNFSEELVHKTFLSVGGRDLELESVYRKEIEGGLMERVNCERFGV